MPEHQSYKITAKDYRELLKDGAKEENKRSCPHNRVGVYSHYGKKLQAKNAHHLPRAGQVAQQTES